MISLPKNAAQMWASLDSSMQLVSILIAILLILASYSFILAVLKNITSITKSLLMRLSPFFKRLHSIKLEGGSISFNAESRSPAPSDDGQKNDTTRYVSHRDCPRYPDILNMIQAQKELFRERHRIQRNIDRIYDVLILKEQMHHAEYQIEEMINLAETLFSQVIKSESNHSDIFASREYREFKGFLELIRDKMVIKIRLMCRDNHFAEKTEAEFAAYVKMQSNLIQAFIREKAHFYFPYGSEFKDYNNMLKTYDSISDSVESFLYTAREITKSKIVEAEELEKEIEALEIDFDSKFGIIGA